MVGRIVGAIVGLRVGRIVGAIVGFRVVGRCGIVESQSCEYTITDQCQQPEAKSLRLSYDISNLPSLASLSEPSSASSSVSLWEPWLVSWLEPL